MKKTLILSLLASSYSYGVNIPSTGDILRQVPDVQTKIIKKELPHFTKEYKEPILLDDTYSFAISKIVFTGNTVISSEKLQNIAQEFLKEYILEPETSVAIENKEIEESQQLNQELPFKERWLQTPNEYYTLYLGSTSKNKLSKFTNRFVLNEEFITLPVQNEKVGVYSQLFESKQEAQEQLKHVHPKLLGSVKIVQLKDIHQGIKKPQNIPKTQKQTLHQNKNIVTKKSSQQDYFVGINKLKQLTALITKYYRNQGYFVARAYIPQQTIQNGIVEIAIIEGIYGEFSLENQSLVDNDVLQGYFSQLSRTHVISVGSLEKQILLVNDLSGVVITNATSYPGKNIGEGNFVINAQPTQKYSSYSALNNYGSRYTGEYKLAVGATVNSIGGVGDALSLNTMISDTQNLKYLNLNYERALGYTGFKGNINASLIKYNLDNIFTDSAKTTKYVGYGTINILVGTLRYPIKKTKSHTQEIALEFMHNNMDDTNGVKNLPLGTLTITGTTKKSVNAATLSISDSRECTFLEKATQIDTRMSLTRGRVNMDNDYALSNDTSQTAGSFSKANVNLSFTQQLLDKTTLKVTIEAQKSFGKNLDSSQDISVSGSGGVRAYEDGELSGDQAVRFSLDLIYSLPPINLVTHQASVFFDTAKVWQNSTFWNGYSETGYFEDNQRILNAIGIGYFVSYKNFDAKVSFAHGFGGESTPISEAKYSTSRNKLLAEVLMNF